MPPPSLVRDVCWLEVTIHPRPGKMYPEVICIHCQKLWFSTSRICVIEYLEHCKELPQHLWKEYQPNQLQSHEGLNLLSSKKRRLESDSWIDRMQDSEVEILDELLAEFFYDAGIA